MKAKLLLAGVLAVLLCLPASALAQGSWYEYFDLYPVGDPIAGHGGWENWGFGADGYVSNFVSRSPSNSLEISGPSDCVHQYYNYTSNKWLYKAWVYIPSEMVGQSYFILLNTYNPPTYAWSVQFFFDSGDGLVHCDCGLSPGGVPIVEYKTDQWSEIRVYVDLDEDWVQIYYDGVLLDDPGLADHPTLGGGYPWTEGVFGGETNALNIGAVDLFANNATPVYYDDMSLTPANLWVNARVDRTSGTRLDYAVVAGRDVGTKNVDTWVIMRTPNGSMSYNEVGPIMGWNQGAQSELDTGPLGTFSGTALDIPIQLPWVGNYTFIVAVDTIPNGVPNRTAILASDSEIFTIP